jgi:hypothetical protein
MLIMRMYALYGRSRKVLAFYIIVAGLIIIVGGVSLNFSSETVPPSRFLILPGSWKYSGPFLAGKKKNL